MYLNNGTIILKNPPSIRSFASVVGQKEGEGPLAPYFDIIEQDTKFGQKTWEQAESQMQQISAQTALSKAGLKNEDIDILFAGDLLNQCIGSGYSARELKMPFYGLYGACSTIAESLSLASIFVSFNVVNRALALTSSHFCSAERQFRQPLEYGGQRTPTSQWTATGSGAIVVDNNNNAPFVKAVTIGKITDLGVQDINNMGAAMAPSAYNTIKSFFKDTKSTHNDYDLILTGDLGVVGSDLLIQLLLKDNIDISKVHNDCGKMLYNLKEQQVNSGGSGCGCGASVLCSLILQQIKDGILKDVLFIGTGALMSPTSTQQGESIPAIAHLVHISSNNTERI